MFIRGIYLSVILTCFCFNNISAQSEADITSWSSVKISHNINDHFTFYGQPIIRHKNDLSEYDDVSIDLSLAYKISSQWSFRFLNRYWWLKDGRNRNFWFIDLKHSFKANDKISIANILRLHQAFDVDFADADFLRWLPSVSFKVHEKVSLLLATDISLRLNGFNNIQRTRSKVGATYSFNKKCSFGLQLWKQDSQNPTRDGNLIMVVPTLGYKL